MPHLGIAVATTLGGWLNAGLLYAHAGRGAASSWPTRACGARCRGSCLRASSWALRCGSRPRRSSPGSRRRAASLVARSAPWRRWWAPASSSTASPSWPSASLDLRQLRGLLRRKPSPGRPDRPRRGRALASARARAITRADPARTSDEAPAKANPARLFRHAADRATCISATTWAPWCAGSRCRRATSASIAWSTCTPSPCGRTPRS